MAGLNDLEIAPLTEEQIKRLQEAEKLINAAGNQDIYLMALKKK
ncbi:hypothetical protein [Neomoorella mulderi]|uniref:Uncharacterized protein n=1 Tax=Moorella mulderi DSM 14980 TaxID=1122241 RepID=A0A151B0N7_9FIRM|nr:hypothetical protein [Moorella mulderi]KYH33464.1 hypothetical protein MOMUL_01650 [Moorella mulderi DSM 14980]